MFENQDEELRALLEAILRSSPRGEYLLAQLLDKRWRRIRRKPAVGVWFKRAVVEGQFSGVEPCGKTNRNHQVYYVRGK